ncbi:MULTISPECIES: DegT/DnrJ/EryC1/StrS aminotransferase family protein [Protofrankia]|uniref:Aminotransferase DegT n=1 Tax=Protofrankia coriariae TaxID=1562887 RepID=A0ABR5F3Y5_9ACTN|nr:MULTISPECIES: DegT/DnrJ/EryC1/StrS family aminotransferase [Protofrankia]KLL11440.1 aminotransferase DegT [Protofrankia coriariae]ONH34380.1 aminotransferase DegT [Protofrankia sp. BMG5.30]
MQVPSARIVFPEADRAEIASSVSGILASGALTLGAYTREFEAAFAAAHDAPFGIAVSSGTAALEIILRALDVAGSDVIIPTNTFAATGFAALRAGANLVFADVDPGTFALSAATVADVLTPSTRAVILVHIGGLITSDVDAIRALCDERGIFLVEDAAHAHGVSHDGRPAGSFGTAAAFSFYPTKVITSGEGGMILTADERVRDEAVIFRDQGKAGFLGNVHIKQGYAWRLSELHAVTGLVHLRRLSEFLEVRRRVAARYDAGLDRIDGIEPVRVPAGGYSNFYKYLALPRPGTDRARLKKELKERHGVSLSGEVYEAPLHQQPAFASYAGGNLPVAEDLCARHVCLPVHSDMTEAEADHVLASLASALETLAVQP